MGKKDSETLKCHVLDSMLIEQFASAKTQCGFRSKWLKFMHKDVCTIQCVDFSHLLPTPTL